MSKKIIKAVQKGLSHAKKRVVKTGKVSEWVTFIILSTFCISLIVGIELIDILERKKT